MTSLYWEDFTFGLLDIGNIVISIIAISNVILGILLYRGLLCRGSAVYLNCINRGALELTNTIMCKPQVQSSDYDLPSTLTRDPYPWPLPSTLALDPYSWPLPWPLPLPLPLTRDPYPWPLPLTRDPRFSNAARIRFSTWSSGLRYRAHRVRNNRRPTRSGPHLRYQSPHFSLSIYSLE